MSAFKPGARVEGIYDGKTGTAHRDDIPGYTWVKWDGGSYYPASDDSLMEVPVNLMELPVNESTERVVELLNEYGSAKFGDEWRPSHAAAWIGPEKARELAGLLDPGALAQYDNENGDRT